MEVSAFAAFIAGLVSFLSPCVLPLVPGYISMLSGIGVEQLKDGQAPLGELLKTSSAFVIGFSMVFMTFGATATAVGTFLLSNRNLVAPIAGAFIVLFGLHLTGLLIKIPMRAGFVIGILLILAGVLVGFHFGVGGSPIKTAVRFCSIAIIFILGPTMARWLNRDFHFRNIGGKPGVISGFLLGFAFAFGWTPCIGPILLVVLKFASDEKTVGRGIFLLGCYSAGLAIPFLLSALAMGYFFRFYQKFRRYLHVLEVASGVLLLAIGGLIFFNRLTWLSGKLSFLQIFAR
ncbi:MAG: cytochrome c biogenesis protein CcdA [Candidatus Acidiferrales bacterium]